MGRGRGSVGQVMGRLGGLLGGWWVGIEKVFGRCVGKDRKALGSGMCRGKC